MLTGSASAAVGLAQEDQMVDREFEGSALVPVRIGPLSLFDPAGGLDLLALHQVLGGVLGRAAPSYRSRRPSCPKRSSGL